MLLGIPTRPGRLTDRTLCNSELQVISCAHKGSTIDYRVDDRAPRTDDFSRTRNARDPQEPGSSRSAPLHKAGREIPFRIPQISKPVESQKSNHQRRTATVKTIRPRTTDLKMVYDSVRCHEFELMRML